MIEKIDLDNFIGTENWYKHFTGITYTDGIKYLADETQSHWLIDLVASYQTEKKVRETLKNWRASLKIGLRFTERTSIFLTKRGRNALSK